MPTLSTQGISYEVLATEPGLRLVHLVDDDVAFIEFDDVNGFYIDDLADLVEYAGKVGWFKGSSGFQLEEAWLFEDGFGDRIMMFRKDEA